MKIANYIWLFMLFWPLYLVVKLITYFNILTGKNKKRPEKNAILYLAAFFPGNAGFHYRVKKWAEIIEENGTKVHISCIFKKDEFEGFSSHNDIRLYIRSMYRRFFHCLKARNYKTVIVRRDLVIFNDYGGLFMEELLLSLHPNVVLDFDDDIAFAKREPKSVRLSGQALLESRQKFTDSLRLYSKFITGSHYLKDLVMINNPLVKDENIIVIPSCVDYSDLEGKVYETKSKLSFGWIGGNHNLKLLDKLIPVLNKLSSKHHFDLRVISGKQYEAKSDFRIINIPWSMETQINDLRNIDIGLMPLNDTREDKGKCGFKLIQYMGLGIVSVASGVTVNKEIIKDGENGFLVKQNENWEAVLEEAISKKQSFLEIGERARKHISDNYSFKANKEKYLNFIR